MSQAAAELQDRAASVRANAATVGFLGGELGGTTLRFAVDLANVLDDGDRMRVLPIVGRGGYQSAEDLLLLHGVDLAILPSDLFSYYRRERLHPGAENQIRYVAKLYDQELHILARPGINSLADLAHETVSVDLPGTASSVTAAVMFKALGIPAELVNDSNANALQKLKRGHVAAMVFLAGKPVSLFASIPRPPDGAPGLHFLSVPDSPALKDAYLPAKLDHDSYPDLVPEGGEVSTIAVGAILSSYNWPPGSERGAKVRAFVDAMFDKFPALLHPPSHPRWADVDLAEPVAGWTRLPAAEEALRRRTASQ